MVWIEQLHSADWVELVVIGLGAYLLGCCATGYYLVRWRTGMDIRKAGSGSVGARNVSRLLGVPGFVLTVLGDFCKGALAVWATQHLAVDQKLAALAMLAVVAGHIWPAQLRLHGGKGMATSLGALCVFDFHLALVFALLFGIGLVLLRKTTVPGLVAVACLPLVSAYLSYKPAGHAYQSPEVLSVSVLASMVLLAHRKNLTDEVIQFLERRNFDPKHTPPEL